jgi:uncharacterized protein (DUF2267 family)
VDKRTFVREVGIRLGCDERRASGITFVVLQELRNRLTPEEVRDVAAQLPTELKRYWAEPAGTVRRVERTHRVEFLGRVRRWAALVDETEAERAVMAVFAVLQLLLGSTTGLEGEAWDVFSQLPKDLKKLWIEAHTIVPMSAATPNTAAMRERRA